MRSWNGVAMGALCAIALVGCDEGTTGPGEDAGAATVTVDAYDSFAYVRLGDPAEEVTPADPSTSTEWDMAFHATTVMLNGGAAGPGDVEGVCICQNAGLADEVIAMLEPSDGLADFEAVTAASIPADEDAWESDELDPVIEGWWSYDMATHQVSAVPEAVWKVRTAEGTGYAKLHVTDIAGATQESAGQVTLEFAVQTEAGGAMGASQELVVDVSDGPVYVDLLEGAVSDESDWDLRLEGYTIRVNGGVSGDGQAGAVIVNEPYGEITDASDLMARLYAGDAYGGVFSSSDPGAKWYRYNIQGNHFIYPTYNVYLIRRGDAVWKVQLISYYGETGQDDRHITMRYEFLAD